MRRAALAGAAVVLVLGALLVVRPYFAAEHDIPASMPSPASLRATATVPLVPGEPTCFRHAAIERHSEQVRFNVSSPNGPAPPIRVRVHGGPYDYTGVVPAGTLDTQQVHLPIPAPPDNLPVRVCLSVVGDRDDVGLFASPDRTISRSVARVGGERQGRSVWFAFYENEPHTLAERLPATVSRITVFRPGYVGAWLVWALAALFVVGVPLGASWAYVRAAGDEERAAPRRLDVNRRRPWWRRAVD